MKKILAILAATFVLLGLAAIPAQAVETTSLNSIHNLSASDASVEYQTANGTTTVFSLDPGAARKTPSSPSWNPVLRFRVPAGCTSSITNPLNGTTYVAAGGVWREWVPTNGIPNESTTGTSRILVTC